MRKTLLILALAATAACGKDTHSAGGKNGGSGSDPTTAADPNKYTGPTVATQGRYVDLGSNNKEFAWAGSKITTRVEGATSVAIKIKTSNPYEKLPCFLNVSVDGGTATAVSIDVNQTVSEYPVTLPDTKAHQVTWTKVTEASYCQLTFSGIDLPSGGSLVATSTPPNRHIEFIGDSITNGYGVLGSMTVGDGNTTCNGNSSNSSSDLSFAKLTADALYADYTLIAYSGKGLAINQDGSASTTHDAGNVANANNVMPAMFLDAVPPVSTTFPTPQAWDPTKYTPDVVVINLGTNDFTAAHNTSACTASVSVANCCPTSANFVTPYVTFVQKVRATYPKAHILLLNSVMLTNNYPNGGQQFTTMDTYLQQVVSTLGDANVAYHKFSGPQDTSQPVGCDSHPSAATHAAMAAEVSATIKTNLGWQ